MKFYDCKTAPSPRRVRILMAEKGIEIATVEVDLGRGEQLEAYFRSINPDCTVPVLELDDGSYLSEVIAISQYLEAKFPQSPLLGASDEERATVLMWTLKVEQQGLLAVANAFRNSAKGLANRALPGEAAYEQIPELAARGREQFGQFLQRLDGQLAGNDYVAGRNFSIADIAAMVAVDFSAWLKIQVPDELENLRRWYASVSSRPSAAA